MSDSNERLDERIPGIIILTHGRFGEELVKSAEMIMGPMESVKALSLLPGIEPDDFMAEVTAVVESMAEGSLLISDLFGGTPANVSAAISMNKNVSAVAGLSLGMLIEAVSCRMELRGEALGKAVIEAGRNGCQSILVKLQELDSL